MNSFPVVQFKHATGTDSVTFDNPVTSGNIVVAFWCCGNSGGGNPTPPTSAGDNNSNSYSAPSPSRTSAGFPPQASSALFVCLSVGLTPHNPFTVSFSGSGGTISSGNPQIFVLELEVPAAYMAFGQTCNQGPYAHQDFVFGWAGIMAGITTNPAGMNAIAVTSAAPDYGFPVGAACALWLVNFASDALLLVADVSYGGFAANTWSCSGTVVDSTAVNEGDGSYDGAAVMYQSFPLGAGCGTSSTTLTVSCNNPPSGVVGTSYSHAFSASGGATPYTWSISAGSLPTGTSLNTSTGVVSGTPSVADTFSFTVEVTDADSNTATVDCSIVINSEPPPPPTLTVSCNNPPGAVIGQPYDHAFSASGGVPPYTWSITSGSLPPGLTLSSGSGVVSGIPTSIGYYGFNVTVTDSNSPADTASVFCNIQITGGFPPGTTTVLYEWQPSFIPKREVTLARVTDYTDCGYKGRKFIRGFRMHANTFGQTRTLLIQYDGGQSGPSFTALHNGEETIAYSLTPVDEAQPLVATYVRLAPIDATPADWALWDQDTEWEYDPYPDLTTLRTPWNHPSGGGLCWVQGIRLTADTANLPQTLQILGDGGALMTTVAVTHNGQQTLPYTWAPFLAHDLAIQPLGNCAIWNPGKLEWVFTPVPENVTYWVARPTSFGFDGYFHLRDGVFAYGGGPGTLMITLDTGETQSIALPAATEVENKLYFVANPLKGMLATLSAIGNPTLQVYVEDIELRGKQWGSTGPYRVLRIPGDISRVEARI